MFCTSFMAVRHGNFELFWYAYHFFVVFVITILFHGVGGINPNFWEWQYLARMVWGKTTLYRQLHNYATKQASNKGNITTLEKLPVSPQDDEFEKETSRTEIESISGIGHIDHNNSSSNNATDDVWHQFVQRVIELLSMTLNDGISIMSMDSDATDSNEIDNNNNNNNNNIQHRSWSSEQMVGEKTTIAAAHASESNTQTQTNTNTNSSSIKPNVNRQLSGSNSNGEASATGSQNGVVRPSNGHHKLILNNNIEKIQQRQLVTFQQRITWNIDNSGGGTLENLVHDIEMSGLSVTKDQEPTMTLDHMTSSMQVSSIGIVQRPQQQQQDSYNHNLKHNNL